MVSYLVVALRLQREGTKSQKRRSILARQWRRPWPSRGSRTLSSVNLDSSSPFWRSCLRTLIPGIILRLASCTSAQEKCSEGRLVKCGVAKLYQGRSTNDGRSSRHARAFPCTSLVSANHTIFLDRLISSHHPPDLPGTPNGLSGSLRSL